MAVSVGLTSPGQRRGVGHAQPVRIGDGLLEQLAQLVVGARGDLAAERGLQDAVAQQARGVVVEEGLAAAGVGRADAASGGVVGVDGPVAQAVDLRGQLARAVVLRAGDPRRSLEAAVARHQATVTVVLETGHGPVGRGLADEFTSGVVGAGGHDVRRERGHHRGEREPGSREVDAGVVRTGSHQQACGREVAGGRGHTAGRVVAVGGQVAVGIDAAADETRVVVEQERTAVAGTLRRQHGREVARALRGLGRFGVARLRDLAACRVVLVRDEVAVRVQRALQQAVGAVEQARRAVVHRIGRGPRHRRRGGREVRRAGVDAHDRRGLRIGDGGEHAACAVVHVLGQVAQPVLRALQSSGLVVVARDDAVVGGLRRRPHGRQRHVHRVPRGVGQRGELRRAHERRVGDRLNEAAGGVVDVFGEAPHRIDVGDLAAGRVVEHMAALAVAVHDGPQASELVVGEVRAQRGRGCADDLHLLHPVDGGDRARRRGVTERRDEAALVRPDRLGDLVAERGRIGRAGALAVHRQLGAAGGQCAHLDHVRLAVGDHLAGGRKLHAHPVARGRVAVFGVEVAVDETGRQRARGRSRAGARDTHAQVAARGRNARGDLEAGDDAEPARHRVDGVAGHGVLGIGEPRHLRVHFHAIETGGEQPLLLRPAGEAEGAQPEILVQQHRTIAAVAELRERLDLQLLYGKSRRILRRDLRASGTPVCGGGPVHEARRAIAGVDVQHRTEVAGLDIDLVGDTGLQRLAGGGELELLRFAVLEELHEELAVADQRAVIARAGGVPGADREGLAHSQCRHRHLGREHHAAVETVDARAGDGSDLRGCRIACGEHRPGGRREREARARNLVAAPVGRTRLDELAGAHRQQAGAGRLGDQLPGLVVDGDLVAVVRRIAHDDAATRVVVVVRRDTPPGILDEGDPVHAVVGVGGGAAGRVDRLQQAAEGVVHVALLRHRAVGHRAAIHARGRVGLR